jgi:hypothetical protein
MRLQGILLFLFVGASMLLATVAVGLSTVVLTVLRRFEQVGQRLAHARSDFLHRLLRGLAKNAIQNISDVHYSYRFFFGIGVLRGSHLEEIAEFLQSAMRQIASAPPESSDATEDMRIKLLRDLIAANQRALEVECMCVPYSGTPEPERELLQELRQLPVEDNSKVSAKLEALARAIRFRQDAVERLGKESGRSRRLARWGWYGTLALAILSAILGVMCLGA